MERAQQSEIEPLPPDKDRLSQIRDRVSDHSRERPDGFTSGVAFEKLHPIAPDTALPATLSAVTLLGVLFVLVILVVWLRKHFSCSSSKKGHDNSARSAIGESRPLRAMEPESVRRPNVTVEVPAEDRVEEELDDFKFKLPDVLEDVTDLKYIDELDGTRNVGPSAFEKSEDKPMTTFGSCGHDTTDGTGSQATYAVESLVGPASPRELPVSVKNDRGSGESRIGKFKTAPADQQWIVHRKPPLDWRSYSVNVPKPFGFVEDDFVGDVLRGDSRAKKFSATRSPSLEKDEKSPFPSRKTESSIDFVFEKDVIEKCKNNTIRRSGNSSPIVEVRVQPASTDAHRIYDTNTKAYSTARTQTSRSSESFNRIDEKRSPTEINSFMGKFGACNVGLRICTVNDNANPGFQMEKIEMQNSPRSIDPSLGKENSPRFNFSPKLFGSSDSKSPKFFGSSDQKSPKFFSDNRSKNSSPKLFGTDRTPSPSPQRFAYSDCYRVSQSPLILDNGNGDYFNFEKKNNDTDCYANNNDLDNSEKTADLSKSKVLCESDSLECVMKESPIGQSNSSDNLDTNVNVVPCLSDVVTEFRNEQVLDFTNEIDEDSGNDQILSDRCHSITSRIAGGDINCDETDSSISVKSTLCVAEDSQENLIVAPSGANSANYRRQRLKSISLDSDNAKFIEQNLGIPIAKHLKQENLFDSYDGEKSACLSEDGVNYPSQISPPANECVKRTYFNFNDDESEKFRMFEKTVNSSEIYRESVITISQSEDLVSLADDLELSSKFLRENVPTIAFNEMQPRFSPKEFESSSDGADQILKVNKNKRNLTIDLNKRDIGLEKELSDYDCSDSSPEKRMTPKTPTLKVKATSLDSSETLNLSLPQNNTLQVPQNSISVPNTPKRQLKRTLTQKVGKLIKASHYNVGNCGGNLNEIVPRICSENQQGRKLYMNVKCPSNFIDSGIFLRENHANLMLFQATKYPISRNVNNNSTNFTRRMGSFDENMVDYAETNRVAPSQLSENRLSLLQKPHDTTMLGSNLLSFKQNLSVSSTNLKTLPEGVPSNDFEIQPEEKSSKKTLLQRRGSNQSLTINLDNSGSNLKYSTLSLQGSNLSLASFGASNHNLASIKNSASNFSLNTDNRQKKNILERRNSNTSLTLNLDYASQHCSRFYSSSHCNLQGSHYSLVNQEIQTGIQGKKCLLQRRGSNTSLTLNLQSSSSNLNRCTSNSSLNIHNEIKVGQKKGLLERRSSNTSLTLNINNSSTQFDNNRILSISNYNLDGAGSGLSRYNSNQSINNSSETHKKGLLERRNSNTSLTLNINSSNFNLQSSDVPRDIEIDDSVLQNNLKTYTDGDSFHGNRQREKHRKSLSTENLFSKSYKSRMQQCKNLDNVYSFGSHDNLWSNCCNTDSMDNIESSGSRNLTYICGDQENEIIYAFGDRHHIENVSYQAAGPVRNITTKPLSPHSTSEDFKLYLANIQHLQNASNVLSRQQLKDLNSVFQDGYSKTDCPLMSKMQKEMTHIDFVALNLKQLDIEGPKCQEDMNEGEYNPQRLLPEPVLPCPEYQKSLLRNLHHEFWDLPTNFQEKPMVFGSHPKNRYKSILPNEHSRVILRAEPGENDEGYINANYVKGYEYTKNSYIATQGPLQNTIYDFWLMVYQNGCQFHRDGCTKTNEERHFGSPQSRTKSQSDYGSKRFTDSQNISIQKIVMLTNLLENGRQKCEKYFPTELHEEMVFQRMPNSSYSSSCGEGSFFSENELVNDGDEDLNTFKVKNVGVINKTGYTVRKLHVEYKNKFLKEKIECSKLSDLTETGNNSEKLKISIIEPEDSSETSVDSKTDYLVVYHYWFDNWADHKCPKDVTALLDLSLDVLQCKIMDFEILDKSKLNSKSGKEKKSHDADTEGVSKERRMSAFQSAKAFFDEFSRMNAHDEFIRPGSYRKNSLASKLDLPMPKNDIVRRESTGAIDSSRIKGKSLFCETKEDHAKKRTVLNMKCDKTNTLVEMPPIIVHCSAGIGRTGCLIAVMNGIKQLKADEKVDILGIVCNMRLNRGGMVQNSEQYELIHKVLCLYEEKNLLDID